MARHHTIVLIMLGALCSIGSAHAAPDCAAVLSPKTEAPALAARLRAEDLVGLRDIGASFEIPIWAGLVPAAPRAMALSPDGTRLAFDLRRADPVTNTVCGGIFVIARDRPARPLAIDLGGDLIRFVDDDFRGKAGFPTGLAVDRLPQWTPDGKAVLFLKKVDGVVQVWRAEADGSGSRAVTRSKDDVRDFRIADAGQMVLYRTQPELRLGRATIETEGRSGFHYDGRFSPMTASEPFVHGPLPFATWGLRDEAGAEPRPADAAQVALFGLDLAVPKEALASIVSRHGDRAWLAVVGEHYPPRLGLSVRLADGRTVACAASTCPGDIADMWWGDDGHLRFMHREGWAREAMAIYDWRPGKGAPRPVYRTNDLLTGCISDHDAIICLREASAHPRYIDRIDLVDGGDTTLFDPNAQFAALDLGKIERLHWTNNLGLETFGDLVLPVGYQPGKRYPLIVVQYESRGFLRGGTGDEYPIQLFAANGFAVLSFNRPPDISAVSGAKTVEEAQRAIDKGFADRRSVQSALEAGVKMVIDRGIADPERIGITGLSDGASTTYYALINSHLFKAAALSSCCWDASLAISVGPEAMRHFAATYPGALSDNDPFWQPISIADNAAHLDVPILMQVSDGELLSALTAITALQEHHQPADMYVYPDEVHVKWQPAHRLAIYRRSLAWFQFWLGNGVPIDAPADELARWTAMRGTHKGV